MGHKKVILEIDSSVAVALINKDIDLKHPYGSVIARIKEMLMKSWQVSIKLIYHESKRAADWMAELGHSLNLGVCLYFVPPIGHGVILRDDLVGVVLP